MEEKPVAGKYGWSVIDEGIHETITKIKSLQVSSRISPNKCQERKEEEKKLDYLEQLKKRNTLRFVGVKEEGKKNVRNVVTDLIKTKLEIDLEEDAITSVSRDGNPRRDGRPRHVLVHFKDIKTKNRVYRKKKLFKGSKVVIMEDLTPLRVQLVKESSSKYGKQNVWTQNGHIFAKRSDEIIEIE